MCDTVDGNPAPPAICETPLKMGYSPYQLMQDFFHQHYNDMCHGFCLLKLSCYDMYCSVVILYLCVDYLHLNLLEMSCAV